MAEELIRIDFTRGIQSSDIQFNFDSLGQSLRAERLRTSGYGVISGFDIQEIDSLKVRISSGTIINTAGRFVEIASKDIELDPLTPEQVTNENLLVNEQGEIFLPYAPQQINSIVLQTDQSVSLTAISINKNVVTVNATWAGREVIVDYQALKPRADAFFVSPQGDIDIIKSLPSSSPSHVDLEQYPDKIIIGVVVVYYDNEMLLEIYNNLKNYRRIYVDDNNILYIHGRPFKGTQIYLEEPDPSSDVFWYDHDSNKILAWVNDQWTPVNDTSVMPFTEVKVWHPTDEDYPDDNQTFLFAEADINMLYLPGFHQLQVIVDNSILMSDQLTEIVETNEAGFQVGIGFALKEPLDKKSYVEVRVIHSAQRAISRQVFQRSAIFVETGFVKYNPALHANKTFMAKIPYIAGEKQLEVFINGKRIDCLIDENLPGFYEMIGQYSMATDYDRANKKTARYFKLSDLVEIQPDDLVSHQVTVSVHSYDHLKQLLNSYEERLSSIESAIRHIELFEENPENYIKKDDDLSEDEIPLIIKDNLLGEPFYEYRLIANEIELDLNENDYIQVFADDKILIRNVHYTVDNTEEGIKLVFLNPELYEYAYITGIRRGF